MFALLREFNATLSPAERVHVRAIDVNLDDYGGPAAFRDLLETLVGHLTSAGPVTAFLRGDYATPTTQTEAIESLRAALEAEGSTLIAAWGSDWYDYIVEMVEVEPASIEIRADREEHYERSTRDREDAIKGLADARIAGSSYRTVINIGGTHAQKSRLIGTDLEWLGDYLVHHSSAIDGTVSVVGVTSVAVNYEETIYLSALKEQYDAVLQYGLAHRVPID